MRNPGTGKIVTYTRSQELNTAELWTHFGVPALSPSALGCFIFLLCAYSYQHLVARAVLQWLITAGEPWRTIAGGLPLPFHVNTACEWHWWNIRKVNLERRQHQRMRRLDGITDSWTWVWAIFGSWWWTGRPVLLWFMGLQRVRHDWATEVNWTTSCQS